MIHHIRFLKDFIRGLIDDWDILLDFISTFLSWSWKKTIHTSDAFPETARR